MGAYPDMVSRPLVAGSEPIGRRLAARPEIIGALTGIVVGASTWWLVGWAMDELRRLQDFFFPGSTQFLLILAIGLGAGLLTVLLLSMRIAGYAAATVLGLWVIPWAVYALGATSGIWEFFIRAHEPLIPTIGFIWLAVALLPRAVRPH